MPKRTDCQELTLPVINTVNVFSAGRACHVGSEGERGRWGTPTMALHIWGKEGTMGNSDHGTTYTYTASRRDGCAWQLAATGGQHNSQLNLPSSSTSSALCYPGAYTAWISRQRLNGADIYIYIYIYIYMPHRFLRRGGSGGSAVSSVVFRFMYLPECRFRIFGFASELEWDRPASIYVGPPRDR